MAIPVASLFVDRADDAGDAQFRDFGQTFTAQPEMGAVPFTGPLAILTDEGTASASEMLAAGLQEAKRAIVVGDTTLGAVLPSRDRGAARRRRHAVRGRRLQDAEGRRCWRGAASSPTGASSRRARRCAAAATPSLTRPWWR